MKEKVFQVSEFNEFINIYLSQVEEVIVEGEISQIKVSQKKWIFLTIKDKGSSVEVFGTVFQISGFDLLEPGMLVHVYGTPRLYKKTGRFSIFASRIVPAGEGALRLAFEKLKIKLEKEGLFAVERKRELPAFPERIGLITAKGSNAYGDFIKVLKARMGGIKIYFYPVTVQGRDSVTTIISALRYFNDHKSELDLLVLVRGGGSLEDLQSFNDEMVARAIFSSKIPVVCGVGHEDDVTIADLVCDLRASTPSNAAELIVRNRTDVINDINNKIYLIGSSLRQIIEGRKRRIFDNVNILQHSLRNRILFFNRAIDKFRMGFSGYIHKLSSLAEKINISKQSLEKSARFWIEAKKTSLVALTRLLESLDFKRVLKRGYSITFGKNGKILKSAVGIEKGDIIRTMLEKGRLDSKVLAEIKNYGKK